jgi:hypothetical protein
MCAASTAVDNGVGPHNNALHNGQNGTTAHALAHAAHMHNRSTRPCEPLPPHARCRFKRWLCNGRKTLAPKRDWLPYAAFSKHCSGHQRRRMRKLECVQM